MKPSILMTTRFRIKKNLIHSRILSGQSIIGHLNREAFLRIVYRVSTNCKKKRGGGDLRFGARRHMSSRVSSCYVAHGVWVGG